MQQVQDSRQDNRQEPVDEYSRHKTVYGKQQTGTAGKRVKAPNKRRRARAT